MSIADQTRETTTSILVVDDLPEKHLAYEAMLEELGSNIVSVRSGADALKQILQRDFAVILLDVNMPEMDGFETARLIRQRKRSASTPIIFLTAFADEVKTAQGYATGAVDYLPTPVVPAILRAKVRVFIDLFEMRRQMAKQAEERAKQAAMAEANRRLSFLADAGAVLGRSLNFEATARDIVRLPVPWLADSCLLKLNANLAESHQIVLSQSSDDAGSQINELQDLTTVPVTVQNAIGRVMESANSELVRRPDDCSDQFKMAIVFPLQARGRTFAVLVLSSIERGFDPNDLKTAEAYCSRAAIALDNSLLHDEIRRADRQKNDFLSMLAHELRNPLAPIRNAAQLLEIRVPDEPEVRWACEVVDRQVMQMVRLVDDLLDVARITRDKILLHRETLPLATVVERAVEASRPVIAAGDHELFVEHSATPVMINGDLARLTQVLTNLLNNAAKYTEPKGQIWLTTSIENDAAVIRVRDTGIGIPSHMLESVFELFTQVDRALERSHGGLGIGLTLVKRLVEMHGGTVEARSKGLGNGSEFILSLPIHSKLAEPDVDHPDAGRTRSTTVRRILVVDDNRDSAQTLSMMLDLMGHQTAMAFDGQEAIDSVANDPPELIFLDIGLPRLNGYEVCRRIRELPGGNEIVIVALTGWGQEDDRRRSTDAGFDFHLVKPIDLATMEELLANLKLTKTPVPIST